MTNDGSSPAGARAALPGLQSDRELREWWLALLHDHNNALPIRCRSCRMARGAGTPGAAELTLQTASDVLPVLRLWVAQLSQCWGNLMRMTTPVKFLTHILARTNPQPNYPGGRFASALLDAFHVYFPGNCQPCMSWGIASTAALRRTRGSSSCRRSPSGVARGDAALGRRTTTTTTTTTTLVASPPPPPPPGPTEEATTTTRSASWGPRPPQAPGCHHRSPGGKPRPRRGLSFRVSRSHGHRKRPTWLVSGRRGSRAAGRSASPPQLDNRRSSDRCSSLRRNNDQRARPYNKHRRCRCDV